MMLVLFAIANSLLVRVQYEFVVHPRSLISRFRLLYEFLVEYQHRNVCRSLFPLRLINSMLIPNDKLQMLVLGFLVDCELMVGRLIPICPTQHEIPIVSWIWTNY